ncbi:MAG: helix-turn-helix transcriptional regulator [Ruminococcus sp.]|nr:helix-turn-helix transcriptional regulator [Ruminococcus sp.]
MENTQIIAENIKLQIKKKNITIKKMLEECSLGVNTVSKMASGTDVTTRTLYKIADYLDCSVDYLLGRTDKPDSHKL